MGRDVKKGGKKKGRKKKGGPDALQPVRPDELLLILGPKRTFPVVLATLTIVEQKFALDLTPIRAEVDLKFNVLEPVDVAFNVWVGKAFDEVSKSRKSLSAKASESTDASEAIRKALNPSGGR